MPQVPPPLDQSIKEYCLAVKRVGHAAAINPGPWIAAKGVSRTRFASMSPLMPGYVKVAYEEHSGTVLLYGEGSAPHARTTGWFMKVMVSEIIRVLGSGCLNKLDFTTETFQIPGWGEKTPDFAIISEDTLALACFVVEVGYHVEQSFAVIKDEVRLWERYGSPVILGIKITDNANGAHAQDPRIEVFVKIQNKADQTFHLGQGSPSPCLGSGTHILEIPAQLLVSQPSVSVTERSLVCIDLFDLQAGIRRWVYGHFLEGH